MELTQKQKDAFLERIKAYKQWLKTSEGQENLEEHKKHSKFFKEKLSKKNIEKLDENSFGEIYKKLWASNIWSNKEWYIQNKLIRPNGLSIIKKELKELLYGDDRIDVRYDKFRENVKGFGPSSISEILHFVFPEKYCLWNDKPKTVLPYLNVDILPKRFFKYNLTSGEDYLNAINVLSVLKDLLEQNGLKNPDFIDLDCVFWHTFNNIEIKVRKEEPKPAKEKPIINIKSHEAAEYYLLKLGEILNYSTYTADRSKKYNEILLGEIAHLQNIPDFAGERDKTSARLVDVIWFNESENPEFCFEIEHTTDITKGLTRLMNLSQFRTALIVVSSDDMRKKFHTEITKNIFRKHKDRFRFVSYKEMVELYEAATKYYNLKNKLLG